MNQNLVPGAVWRGSMSRNHLSENLKPVPCSQIAGKSRKDNTKTRSLTLGGVGW